ncbi:MAG: hypothetical protein Kilf2KO_38970 [Rhodospirillales bacterium]
MAQNTADLIKALLKSGRVSSDTQADLEEFLEAAKAGTLDAPDRSYVEALAGRLLDGKQLRSGSDEAAADDENEEDDEDYEDDAEWDALEERAETAEARVEELESEVEELQRRIDALEGELATLKSPEGL